MKKDQQSMPSSPSSSTFLPLTILISLAFLSLAFGEQTCTEDFHELVKERNITNCKTLRTLGAEFGWSYHYNKGTNSTIIDILFGVKVPSHEGWIAWGVNPGKRAEMIGTQAIIGIIHSEGPMKIGTYDITSETKSGCKLLPSSIGIISSSKSMEISYDNRSDLYTISATLDLPQESYNISRLNHVWQVGVEANGNQPFKHPTTLRNVDSTETINLISGKGIRQDRSYLRSVHGVLNMIGWGTMLPIGVIIARYFRVFPFKADPMWFYLHVSCQICGFLVGTAGWIIGLYLGNASRHYIFHAHRTFGILIFVLSTVQMLAFRLKPKVTDDYRKFWNMYHHFLGYGVVSIIVINIFKGISILKGGPGWKWAYIGILILLGIVTLGLEITTWVIFYINNGCCRWVTKKARNPKGDNKSPMPEGLNKRPS
ncbi:hypothetical protein RIF29_18015 [Crotalaria pallida]|uniref:Cytochrome b561 and DOMON domain-containing protein n=1 Tax=Crotalaria pallida TaxID=3830 RepID=A0AAN9FIA7_CROPI